MKVVFAIDSFKGSLDSVELGEAGERGLKKVFSDAETRIVSMADGGEGTVESLIRESHGHIYEIEVTGPAMQKVKAKYGIMGNGKTAAIEMAAASGITMVEGETKNPMDTTTYGTGELIKDALEKGCREFIIGIGGSATNDAGMGMLQALGYEFFDKNGNSLGFGGKQMAEVASYNSANAIKELFEATFTIACDVDNPFYGKRGASYIYGPQKGADEQMVKDLDDGLRNFADVIKRESGKDISDIPGAGAAGGLGGGFVAFLDGELKSGVDIVIETIKLSEIVKDADFVITGEGRLDNQTSMGKTPVGVSKCAKQYNIPVIAIAGGVIDGAKEVHNHGIDSFFSVMNGPITLEEAMDKKNTAAFVESNIEEIFRLIKAVRG